MNFLDSSICYLWIKKINWLIFINIETNLDNYDWDDIISLRSFNKSILIKSDNILDCSDFNYILNDIFSNIYAIKSLNSK